MTVPTKTQNITNYTSELQLLFISMFFSDPELFVRCQNILKPSFFSKEYAGAIKFIKDHANEYHGLPPIELINAQFQLNIQKIDISEANKEWFLDTIEKFCRHKALEAAILKSADMLEDGRYGEVEVLIKEAVLTSLLRELGTNYFGDPRIRLEKLLNQNGNIKTGWNTLDEVIYNVGRGELLVFTAVTGGGKSIALQNLSVNWATQNFNIVYVTLELSEELVAKRLDAMITGIPGVSIFRQIDKVEVILKQKEKHYGSIYIKYMKPGTSTNDLRAYLKEFQIQTGLKPDMIIIDYLDLMHPNAKKIDISNFFVKDKFVSEELRGLGAELEAVVASASQLNRCLGVDTLVFEQDRGYIRIIDLNIGDKILSKNNTYNTVKTIYPIEKQKLYKITTASGKNIICSNRHMFPTETGFKSINEGLTCGEKVLTKIEN